MAYIRLVVLILLFEVLVTAVLGVGYYFGFSVYPYGSASSISFGGGGGGDVQTTGFNATIPLYMPSLQDLKAPYTLLQGSDPRWGAAAVLISAALIVFQSFIRGMYLGGIKEWVLHRKIGSLTAYGRRYFGSMLAWSVLQFLAGSCLLILAAAFFPVGLFLIAVMMFYSLTPYLIVLQGLPLGDALAKAPRAFRHYFSAMLPIALLAMVFTFAISLTKTLPSTLGYAVPLLLYACIGTLLIAALMSKLAEKLRADGERVSDESQPQPLIGKSPNNRLIAGLNLLLVPALIAAGVYTASGKHLSAMDLGNKTSYDGINYRSNFSDVFYASSQSYTAYEWQDGDYSISIKLPDLTGDRKPEELRGIADIKWRVNEEVRTVSGNSTLIDAQMFWRTSTIMYRLVRSTSIDGTVYYSSHDRHGYASLLPGEAKPREPLSVGMFVSGDGQQLFVTQYSARLESSVLHRVSEDGRFLVPGTSQMNPMDVQSYWFTKTHDTDTILEMLSAKNKESYTQSLNRIYMVLAVALQEGDGRMVVDLLDTMRRKEVDLQAPDWDAEKWTSYLRGLYEGASVQDMLGYLTKAGEQGGYAILEDVKQSNEQASLYRLGVPFPNGIVPITYRESKEDGRLLSLTLFD